MFGVSSVVFHGIALPHIGMPLMMRSLPAPTGAKMITSYFFLRSSSFATSWVLMYEYGTPIWSRASRHQPSSWVESHVCINAMREVLNGCVLTDGAVAVA